jgi:hypothetical protein
MNAMLEPRPSPLPPQKHTPAPHWLRAFVRFMDSAFAVPGTRLRLGLDAIIGFLLPGAGDAISAASHVALLLAAFRARVPGVVIARMVLNVAIDALAGVIPFAGDAFDVVWKANVRNLELIEREARGGQIRATAADYLVVGLAIFAVLLLLSIPFLIAVLVTWSVLRS